MSRLLYEHRTQKDGIAIRLEVDGTLPETTAAIGRLIQQVHEQLPDPVKPAFRTAIRALVIDEDTPIWKATESGIRIDMAELAKQMEGTE
jgi:hypothetical protein